MYQTDLRLDITESTPDQHVVELQGELDLATAAGLAERLTDIAGSLVVVDLSHLTFIDATGLTSLLAAKEKIEAQGHGIEFRHADGIVRRVFEVCGLRELLAE